MAKSVLIDSGAIVAALLRRDQNHAWAKSHLESFNVPCLTCEAVLSESFFLLEHARQGKEALCSMLQLGIIAIDFSLHQHLGETIRLIRRYNDIPMSFADACLVRMAEIHNNVVIFTVDGDFGTYRMNGRQMIPLIAPW